MKQYLYIVELNRADGDIAVPVVSGNPLSPMEIKEKLLPWLKSDSENWVGTMSLPAKESNQKEQ